MPVVGRLGGAFLVSCLALLAPSAAALPAGAPCPLPEGAAADPDPCAGEAPTITCARPDGRWHRDNVGLRCTAADPSGLADRADGVFQLRTHVPDGAESPYAATGTRQVCDTEGNCATAGPVRGVKVDRRAPSVFLTTPAEGGRYDVAERRRVSYACADSASGVGSCEGTQPDGADLAAGAAELGARSFTVRASDRAGNRRTVTHSYRVVVLPVQAGASPARP